MRSIFYLTAAFTFACINLMGCAKDEAPPKARPVLKAVLKVQGKPDQQIVMQQLPPKAPKSPVMTIAQPPATAQLQPVPAGTLTTPCKSPTKVALKPLKIDPKEHSVLVKHKSTGCGCGNTQTKVRTCTPKRHVQKTCHRNFNRGTYRVGFHVSLGGFGF